MQITLAPIPFYWPKEKVIEFYEAALSWPVDRIVLGETVCAKRRELKTTDWLALATRIKDAGKDVAISTLALLEAESDLKTVRIICQQSELEVEANDLSAVEVLHGLGKPFSAGPFLNIYNPRTLKLLEEDGLTRWTLPVELGKSYLQTFLSAIEARQINVATEVMVHGHLPLALSARCFTARGLDRPKDQCKRVCLEYPTGISVRSQEGQNLFNINGIQTLSGDILDLRTELHELESLGVDAVRIVPSQMDMADIISAYARTLSGEHIHRTPVSSAEYCNGYWFGEAGMLRC